MAETKNISAEEYESLTKDAQFGREMAGALRSEAARLCVAALGLDEGIAKSLSAALAPGELGGFNAALKRLAPPATPQTRTSHAVMDGAFEPYTV